MLGYLSLDIICSSKLTVFLKLRFRETVRFSEQMSADKYPSIFSRQMETIVYIYSGYSAPGSRIAGMEIQVFRNENSSKTNADSHYSSCSYSGLIPNKRALSVALNIEFVDPCLGFTGLILQTYNFFV